MHRVIRRVTMILSLLTLLFIFWAAVAVFNGRAAFESYLQWTGWLTLVWFVLAPFWLWKK